MKQLILALLLATGLCGAMMFSAAVSVAEQQAPSN
jgi:hypothetical protein